MGQLKYSLALRNQGSYGISFLLMRTICMPHEEQSASTIEDDADADETD